VGSAVSGATETQEFPEFRACQGCRESVNLALRASPGFLAAVFLGSRVYPGFPGFPEERRVFQATVFRGSRVYRGFLAEGRAIQATRALLGPRVTQQLHN
jgi:hypothetical protein